MSILLISFCIHFRIRFLPSWCARPPTGSAGRARSAAAAAATAAGRADPAPAADGADRARPAANGRPRLAAAAGSPPAHRWPYCCRGRRAVVRSAAQSPRPLNDAPDPSVGTGDGRKANGEVKRTNPNAVFCLCGMRQRKTTTTGDYNKKVCDCAFTEGALAG